MFKTLTAGLTALSLTLIPATPVHAQNSQRDVNRTVVTLLALGGIALALKAQQDQDRQARVRVHTHTQRAHNTPRQTQANGWQSTRRAPDLIPGRCFRRVETARGDFQGVFGARCLERRYRDAHTLPGQCRVRMGGQNGSRIGYDARCLRDFGYRSDRRWN